MNPIVTSIFIPIIVAVITAFVTHYFTIRKAKLELTQEYNKKFNLRRWDVYMDFVRIVSELIHADHESINTILGREVTENKLLEIEQSILLLGSKELIIEFGKWKINNQMLGSHYPDTVLNITSIINQMRIDLGEKNVLTREEVLDILHPGWQRSF